MCHVPGSLTRAKAIIVKSLIKTSGCCRPKWRPNACMVNSEQNGQLGHNHNNNNAINDDNNNMPIILRHEYSLQPCITRQLLPPRPSSSSAPTKTVTFSGTVWDRISLDDDDDDDGARSRGSKWHVSFSGRNLQAVYWKIVFSHKSAITRRKLKAKCLVNSMRLQTRLGTLCFVARPLLVAITARNLQTKILPLLTINALRKSGFKRN